jgi:hypothetical protein
MAREYLDQLSALLKLATSRRFKDVKLECKHFFSGAAVYADGKICMSLASVGFALKLPEESRNSLVLAVVAAWLARPVGSARAAKRGRPRRLAGVAPAPVSRSQDPG